MVKKTLISMALITSASAIFIVGFNDDSKSGVTNIGLSEPAHSGYDTSATKLPHGTQQQSGKSSKSAKKSSVTQDSEQKRQELLSQLDKLKNCHQTKTCPVDNSDPRGSELLRGQKIKQVIEAYMELTLVNDFANAETNYVIRSFIDFPDGHVQEAVLKLMSALEPNQDNALALIVALADSYNAKIVNQAMAELQRYPELSSQTDELFSQSLQTGSFYVAQEVAQQIFPYLNNDNIGFYEEVAKSLPPKSKRSEALWSNIKEYKKVSSND
ncbi:MAG: hypothetical protein HWE10_09060 [Gammaproteobacteria bacterium]|nr:hypothetical protein [Gammaproteobacteria bacterium]